MSGTDASIAPPALDPASPRRPLSRAGIERFSSRAIAAFGLVFGAQTVPAFLASAGALREPATVIVGLGMLALLIWVVGASVLQRGVRLSAGIAAVGYVIALLAWPMLVVSTATAPSKPWLWYLCTVATGYAALAFRPLLASVYTVVVPGVYGVLHATPWGGNASPTVATLDAVYAVILGGALLLMLTLLRQASSGVDDAQTAALSRYRQVAREHAQEAERSDVDAIVHDSVLTTLLAAAGARTPEAMDVAGRMAAQALDHLGTTGAPLPALEPLTSVLELRDRLFSDARSLAQPFNTVAHRLRDAEVPSIVADALHAAAVQAMVNSTQHAGDADVIRRVTIVGVPGGGVRITVADNGVGFDPERMTPGRMGVRVSIRERVARVSGASRIASEPGVGTTVTLAWPSSALPEEDRS